MNLWRILSLTKRCTPCLRPRLSQPRTAGRPPSRTRCQGFQVAYKGWIGWNPRNQPVSKSPHLVGTSSNVRRRLWFSVSLCRSPSTTALPSGSTQRREWSIVWRSARSFRTCRRTCFSSFGKKPQWKSTWPTLWSITVDIWTTSISCTCLKVRWPTNLTNSVFKANSIPWRAPTSSSTRTSILTWKR